MATISVLYGSKNIAKNKCRSCFGTFPGKSEGLATLKTATERIAGNANKRIRKMFSLSTRVSAFISLALVVVLVVQNNNYRISNFNRIRLYLTQIIILKLIQVILDQLLILNAIKLDPILFYIKHD